MKKRRFQMRMSGPMIICAGTLVFFSLFAKNFFTASNAANIIRQASVLAIVAFGQTFAILIQGFDLSVGAVMGLTACLAAILMIKGIVPVVVAVALALLVASFCGLIERGGHQLHRPQSLRLDLWNVGNGPGRGAGDL